MIYISRRILRLAGTQDPHRLFLDLEQIKKKWFYAQDTRQISKRKKFAQYVVDTGIFVYLFLLFESKIVFFLFFFIIPKGLLEILYPKLQGKLDSIRMIVNVYRQIQQEAFGIVLINKQNKVK